MITGADFLIIGSTDIDRSVRFYGEVLGLERGQRGADAWVPPRPSSKSRGVEFSGDPIDSGVCCQAFFTDPDGNALAIHHRYAEGVPPQADAG